MTLTQSDLQAIEHVFDKKFAPIKKDLKKIKSDLDTVIRSTASY